jgi:hypothetical protein
MYRIVGGKPAEMRHSVRWNGTFKGHVEADVMYLEYGVLFVAATVFCGENNELKGP